ncbi:MAG: hypothetical protein WAK89_05980, partial [Candidatus Sulfotelmatobacter sp.]
MRDGLRLRFETDGDGTGKLTAGARYCGFAGSGGAWFSISRIDEYAGAIAEFPLPANKKLLLAGGFWKEGKLSQEHLALEVCQIDSQGHIGIQVRISSELWPGLRPESQRVARFEIVTTYERLRQFSKDLRELAHGKVEEIL